MKAPVLSGKEMIKYLSQLSFEIVGRKGSHVRMKKLSSPRNLIVIIPNHKELVQGTQRSILRQAGIPFDEFVKSFE
ncbi:MAG: type II toxin-antitoxin system HicA family toxin [Candidatus Thorarchaeota archaeon]|nr:type II toxin-antitoxin system HicA family toxin [Candidatus Thorarchaeota archaeon]